MNVVNRYPEGADQLKSINLFKDDTFLDVCDPRISSFYELWQSKQKGGQLPKRSDFDPSEMKSLLPYMFMVDKKTPAGDYRYRLVGTNEVEIRRYDPTGNLVKDRCVGTNIGYVLEYYDYVFKEKGLIYGQSILKISGPTEYKDQFLKLPTSSDGENVDIVIGIAVQEGY